MNLFSGSQSLCDKEVYYGWKYSIKLQLQSLGFGYNMRNGYGVCRGDEMFALFKFNDQPPPINAGPLTETDQKIVRKITQMWVDFARTTQPTLVDQPFTWEPNKLR